MIIGFDFDKIFINYPPIIPDVLINLFYRKGTMFFLGRKEKKLIYRFPGYVEQQIRILSHTPILRLPIKKNIETLKKINSLKNHKTYLVSSRYSFLRNRTENTLKKHGLSQYFDGIYFNYKNKQPHIFKEKMLKRLKLDMYVDDDLSLLLYLSKKIPKVKFYWHSNSHTSIKLPTNVKKIKTLSEIYKYVKII